jgi:hypothetical protein
MGQPRVERLYMYSGRYELGTKVITVNSLIWLGWYSNFLEMDKQ